MDPPASSSLTMRILLLAVVLCQVLAHEDSSSSAYKYTSENFDGELGKFPHFVMFFAPWCGHCKRLSPTWDELAQKLNVDQADRGIRVSKVDCTSQTVLCKDHGVTGYPTLKFYREGKETARYRGARDLASLEEFIEKEMSAGQTEPEPVLSESSGPTEMSESSFEQQLESGLHFIKFYAPWCSHCQHLAPVWKELAAWSSQASVSQVDCTTQRTICDRYQVRGYPSLLWFTNGQQTEQYNGGRSLEELKAFVEMQVRKSAPSTTQDAEVVDKDLEVDPNMIASEAGQLFVLFHAPGCDECRRLFPVWTQLGQQMRGEHIRIGHLDCSLHPHVCSDVKLPGMLIFHGGRRVGEYQGGVTLDALLTFVLNNKHKDEL